MSEVVLPSVYLGNIEYYSILLKNDKVWIETKEFFVKQSYRNRTEIYGANGILKLIVPKIKGKEKTIMENIQIDYSQRWQALHWKSITSAYRSSPYFEYYEHYFEPLYSEKKYDRLLDFNNALQTIILKILDVEKEVLFTNTFEKSYSDKEDYRPVLSPKIKSNFKTKHYSQLFEEKYGFIPNLSIIDLIFNLGPAAYLHLK